MKNRLRRRRRTKDIIRGGVSPAVPNAGAPAGQLDGLLRSSLHQNEVNVPRGIDDNEETRKWFSIGRLMGVIITLGLVWIFILAILVSRMPDR